MSEKILNLEIITPEDIKLQEKVKLLEIPGAMGRLGILPDHARLLTTVEAGQVKVLLADDRVISMSVGDGLLEVDNNNIIFLADSVEQIYDTQLVGLE